MAQRAVDAQAAAEIARDAGRHLQALEEARVHADRQQGQDVGAGEAALKLQAAVADAQARVAVVQQAKEVRCVALRYGLSAPKGLCCSCSSCEA